MIANCGHNENNGVSGGRAGDQTGGEYSVRTWYSRPWSCVLRYPDLKVGVQIAKVGRDAANNNNIGYDQPRRLTFYNQLKANNWNASAIRTKCDSDCSASSAACVIAAGYLCNISALKNVSPSLTTYVMRSALRSAGFQVLTASKYLTSDSYLLPGDVLLLDSAHAAVNLDAGKNSGSDVVVSEGGGDDVVGGGYGGNLYATENDENDAVMREVGYMSGSRTPTTNKTNMKLSVINYTSALGALFEGRVGSMGGSVDTSNMQGNYRIILEYCIGKGLNAAAGCGICANIRGESDGNPNAVSSDGYGSIGICQWTFGRKTNLINFLNGTWRNNLTGQLDFLFRELNSSYKSSVLIPLQNVPNTEAGARSAADTFVRKFEVPANVNLRSQQRQGWASEFWNQLVIQQSTTILV